MKAIGIIREIDSLGRVVIPKELRREYGLNKGTPLEIFADGKNIIFRLYIKQCTFCGKGENLLEENGVFACSECLDRLASYGGRGGR